MPWQGYNFEDSIWSQKDVTDDDVSSYRRIWVNGKRYKTWCRRNARDIPNVSEESLRNLDESGIVYVGAEVKPGTF